MCFKKTTIFVCRCFLRDTSACPHSAYLAKGELEKSKMERLAAIFQEQARPFLPSSLLSSPPPGISRPPGISAPPLFSPASASSSSTSPGIPTRAPTPAPPRIIDGLFYERKMGEIQRAVHWDVWRTEWFPCAAYHCTHLDTVVNSEEEYMNSPEYFGDEDKEVRVLGLCEECRGVHRDELRGVDVFGGFGNQNQGNGGDGQGRAGGQKDQADGGSDMPEVKEALNRWMDMA
ncbi:hypothetical protein B0H65DRAFT_583487 [Neurospora tetraspora]|uniref:Uncharacterized protein n=1 Tax=Neurospora tetraspora TaxID=94610 RepID=A0AAE0J2K6_9PEZI|nr:hypothetical protein B0H65DRAFT_583487 [Neurospora tetraspora]